MFYPVLQVFFPFEPFSSLNLPFLPIFLSFLTILNYSYIIFHKFQPYVTYSLTTIFSFQSISSSFLLIFSLPFLLFSHSLPPPFFLLSIPRIFPILTVKIHLKTMFSKTIYIVFIQNDIFFVMPYPPSKITRLKNAF